MCLILPAFSSPDLKAFPLCSKSSKSSEGGQGETVSSTSFQPQTRLTLASALGHWWFLVTVCACGGKTPISRLDLYPSATCRGLTSLPPMAFAVSFRIRFADAKTAVKHHRPTHILPLEHHLICNLISRPKDSSQVVSIAKECILRLSPPDAFIEQVKFCNLLYDIYLLYGMDVLKTCNQLA